MIIPGIIITLIFSYFPLMGSVMAFQNYRLTRGFFGSEWVGFQNFNVVMNLPGFWEILRNTVVISSFKIMGGVIIPLIVALLLNELMNERFKRVIQTMVYLPYFLSWVILSGIFVDLLSPSNGIVNQALSLFGIEPIFFLADKFWFPVTMILTDIWKTFGFGTVIFLAALTSINPALYEACMIDGGNRWKQTWHITLPGILPIIILVTVLGLGNLLDAGFDQIFNMINPTVYSTGDIIDTFVYRLGLEQMQYSLATAVGLMKSVVALFLISLAYYLAYKVANYRIF
jgi:putative aldouronate transport system permease protein